MITARELVFYIRAEDQASRVVKRAARSFGSLSNIRGLEQKAVLQQVANLRKVEQAQLAIRRNADAISRAEASAARMGSTAATRLRKAGLSRAEALNIAATQQAALVGGNLGKGTTAAVSSVMAHEAALGNLATLRREEELLGQDLDEVRRKGLAASAAIDAQISAAKIARTENYITAVQGVARAFRLLGIAAAASLAFAAHAAAQFQTQATLAATQARPPGAGIGTTLKISQQVQKEILGLMQQFPASTREMSDSFYQIFSGTNIQNVKQAAQYVKLFNEAAVGGGATLDEMTQAGISIRNVFGIGLQGEFKNMTQALNVFFSAVRYGRMTASQFAQALGYISPIAKDVHLSFRNVAEDMAFFTRQTGGRMTRQDAQGLARLIQLFARSDVTAGLATKGIPVFDRVTGRMRPVLDIIKQIHDQLKLTPQETINFFKTISAAGGTGKGTQGTIQAIRIFSQGIQNAKAYEDVVKNVRVDNNELTNSFKAMQKTPQIQWGVFVNRIKALVYEIGIYAIPALTSMGKYLGAAVRWFDNLSEPTKKTIAVVGTFGSVITVVGTSLIIFAGAIAKAWYSFKLLKLERLASEAGIATPEIALLIAALVALGAVLYKDPHLITQVVHVMGGLKGIIMAVTIAAGAFTLLKVITAIGLTGDAATVATGKVALLRSRLLGLAGIVIPAIVIPILFHEGKAPTEAPIGQQHIKTAGGLMGMFDKVVMGAEMLANKHIKGMTTAQSRADIIAHHGGGPGSKVVTDLPTNDEMHKYEQILSNPIISDQQVEAAAAAIQRGDTNTLNRIWKLTQLTPGKGSPIARRNSSGASVSSIPNAATISVNKQSEWNRLFSNVIRLQKALSDGKVHTVKQYQELLDAEDKLQKASTGNQYQAAQQMLSALESTWNTAEKSATKHQKNLLKIEKQNVQNAKTELGNLLQGVQSIYDNLLGQNQSMFGELFGGPVINGARVQDRLQFGGQVTGTDLLKDLQAQNFQFNQVNKQLDTLSKRGAPKAFLDQVRALGPNASADIKALTKLTPQQFRQYVAAWNTGQKAIKTNTMSQLNGQLKIYEKFGRKVAAAILKGMKSADQGLQNELQNIILKMFPGLAKQAKEVFKFKKVPTVAKMPKLPAHDVVPRGRKLQSAVEGVTKAAPHLNRAVTNNVVHNVRNAATHVNNSRTTNAVHQAATTLSNTHNINNINTATRNLTIHGAVHTITNNAGTINNNYVNNSRTITSHVTTPARQPVVKVTGPAQVSKNTTKNVEEHTHYHITAPTSEHASIRTMIKHTDFSIRNKFKGNL